MIVRVKLFAAARERAGGDTCAVELPDGATVGAVRAALVAEVPELESLLEKATFAVDAEYATDATVIAADAEVACIPPVSGG